MKDQKKTDLDQSLKNMDEHITWDDERQKQSRKMLLSQLEQEKLPKRKSWIKQRIVPVVATILFLGTAGTLFVSEFSEQEHITEQQSENMASNNADQGFEIEMNEEVESKIKEMNESGFRLQLPQYSPVEDTQLKNIWRRSEGQNDVVSASYFDSDGREVFYFLQEDITEIAGVNHLQEKADYETEINGNVTFVAANDDSGLLTINIIANEYGFTLSAYSLSEEELLTIGESIDFPQ